MSILYRGAGIEAVIANTYSRIFYRSCVNGAWLLPLEGKNIADKIKTGDEAEINLQGLPVMTANGKSYTIEQLADGIVPLASIP